MPDTTGSSDDDSPGPINVTDIDFITEECIARIMLNRPRSRNAIRSQTLDEIDAAREFVEGAPDRSVLMVGANGDMFSSGADLSEVSGYIKRNERSEIKKFITKWHRTLNGIHTSGVPVVGIVDGDALAGGLELLLVCDIVVASMDAAFGDQHVNVNLIGAGGAANRLARIIGPRRAKQLLLTGEKISADTAYEWGLVNAVVEGNQSVREFGSELANQIANHHPEALRKQKELVNISLQTSLPSGLEIERKMALEYIFSDAAAEGITNFLDE